MHGWFALENVDILQMNSHEVSSALAGTMSATSPQLVTVDEVRAAYSKAYPNAKAGKIGNAVAMIHKFRSVLKPSDHVITYNPAQREYLVGNIVGDYMFKPGEIKDHVHLRKVDWLGRVSRDQLSVASRNTLGSTLTLFSVPVDVWSDISAALRG